MILLNFISAAKRTGIYQDRLNNEAAIWATLMGKNSLYHVLSQIGYMHEK